uniref:PNPLA domain-containing protein n=1 Tax=viral metagenome TaxID=1070528 RepID=A0A6C0CA39_9ZZZZ
MDDPIVDSTTPIEVQSVIVDNAPPVEVPSVTQYTNLVLSGGGTKGIAHIGAIQKLIDNGLLDLSTLKGVAGSSAGALAGLLIVLGFDMTNILNFVMCLDMKKLINPDVSLFLNKCGVDDGRTIFNLIEEILTKATGIKHINFRQLFELTGINFTVTGTCLTDSIAVRYNHVNTPNFKVSVAIRISISVPILFVPVDIDGKKYIDGSALDNYPMELFADEIDKTIGILLGIEYDTTYNCPEQFFRAVLHLIMKHYYAEDHTKYEKNTIHVTKTKEFAEKNKSCDDMMSDFSFDINNDVKKAIYQAGVDAADKFCTK